MKAGSLEIEILTNISRLQSEMAQVKKSVGGAMGSVTTDLERAASASSRFVRGQTAVTASAGQQRAGMQQLSYQIGDVATQFASGTPAMLIFAQQGSQVVQSLSLMQGGAKGFIGFLSGPWGATVMGAVTVLGMLITRKKDAKSASDGLTTALQYQKMTTSELTAAIHENLKASEKAIQSSYAMERAHLASAEAARVETVRKLNLAKANLEAAQSAQQAHAAQSPGDPGATGAGGALALRTGLHEMAIKRLNTAIGEADKTIRQRQIPLIRREVTAATDEAAAATLRYDKAEAGLTNRFSEGRLNAVSYQRELQKLTGIRDREVEAVKEAEKAQSRAEAAARAADKKAEAKARAEAKAAERRAAQEAKAAARIEARLALESSAAEATIGGISRVAAAYLESDAAGMIAEARANSVANSMKRGADIEAAAAQELRKNIVQRGEDAAKQIADLQASTRARELANTAVAAGTMTVEEANAAIQDEMALRPIATALAAAQARGYTDLAVELERIIGLMKQARVADRGSANQLATQSDIEKNKQQIDQLKLETQLLGVGNRERAVRLAQLAAEQKLKSRPGLDPNERAAFIKSEIDLANAQEDNREAADAFNASLEAQLGLMEQIDERANIMADVLESAFGRAGAALGDLLVTFSEYGVKQEQIALEEERRTRAAGSNQEELARIAIWSARERTIAEERFYGDAIGAAKGLFKENSTGYKAMVALEKVLAAIRIANMIKAIAVDLGMTAKSVANAGVRGSADAAAGAAKMFSFLGPFAFPVVAAMVALLASMGLKGLGGGSKGPSIPTAEELQERQGTGSVLGDTKAKSNSIENSLALMLKNTNRDLEYSNQMVRSLRAIESSIGNLASLIARQLGVGGGLDASSLNLGTVTKGGLLGGVPVVGALIGALFGKKTITRELHDQGIEFDPGTVGTIIANGITADLYQQVLKTSKKSGFLGLGKSTKTSIETSTSAADADLTGQVALLVGSMRTSIVEAAGIIGVEGAGAMLDAFNVNIGKISFKDLTGEEIEKELAAVFSKLGDDMAAAAVAGLAEFQKVGEGQFETLARLAREYMTIDSSLKSIGMSFGAVGTASVGARAALIDLFGGLDAFQEQTSFFRENFLSEAEQMAPIIAAVGAEMARLGQSGVDTKNEFKNLVLGLNLSTEAGQSMYASLMSVAPAFAKTVEYTAKLNGEMGNTAKTAEQLAQIEKQRRSLEIQLMEAQGDAQGALNAKRADELAALDETLRALQAQVWAAQDAAQAQRELAAAQEALSRQRRDLDIQLMEALGNSTAALAARRQDELAALDASLRPIQQQIWAALDNKAAQEALAAAEAQAAQVAEEAAAAVLALAQQRRTLEIELMEAQGLTTEALTARRRMELEAMDASLHALQQQVWAAQDAAVANAALAQAQADAAARAEEIARRRAILEIELLRATGQEVEAVARERAAELSALDASLHALQQNVWAAQDAAKAQQDYASSVDDGARAAEDLRRARVSMEVRLLELSGNAAAATALRRQEELAALDASLRPLQQSIWHLEDIAEAAERVGKARDVLTDAYKRESGALQDTIDKFSGFGDSLRKFRGTLGATADGAADIYRQAQARFVDTSSLARMGNEKALGELENVAQDFLTASKNQAGSLQDYQRDVARVMRSVDQAIGSTDEAVDYAQAQLDALDQSVAGLIEINQSVLSVRDAIDALEAEMASSGIVQPQVTQVPSTAFMANSQSVQVDNTAVVSQLSNIGSDARVHAASIAEMLGKVVRWIDRIEGDALPVRTLDGDVIATREVWP